MDRARTAAVLFTMQAAMTACAANTKPIVVVDKPVTITVPVPESVRKAQFILLQLEQVTTPNSAPSTWNMFIELPGADERTSVEVPNFAGYVTTLPNTAATTNPPKGMSLQLPDAAAMLVRKRAEVRLTFVPTEKFAGEGVKIGGVRLEPIH